VAPGMKKCPFCLEMIPVGSSFCAICKADLNHPFSAQGKQEGSTLGGLLMKIVQIAVLVVVILVVIGFAISFLFRGSFQTAREEARRKLCYSNMRVLVGATEMYNMDNKESLQTLDCELLQKGKYLRSIPVCPNEGNHYVLKKLEKFNFEIRCEGKVGAHGTVD